MKRSRRGLFSLPRDPRGEESFLLQGNLVKAWQQGGSVEAISSHVFGELMMSANITSSLIPNKVQWVS